ncbi:A24 family peptidase [Fundidesulfovibrio agrisoli]|uniref:A24 family peptidase n=1 Tax=Fundidesulfovibrio agrisoli TaxID=2922717 RepID=UPI001FAB7A55|nr:prepilin peptidase [Fundidesulfovibrio agrisoli]
MFATETPISVVLAATVVLAAIFDIKFRRIPNALTASGAIAMLGLNYAFGSLDGLIASLLGLVCAFAAHFLLFVWGALGAGDVKLLCVVGAALGAGALLTVWIFVALAGGVQSGLIVLRAYLATSDAEPTGTLLGGRKACYAIAIAAGTLGTLAWRAMGHEYISLF